MPLLNIIFHYCY